MCMFNAHIQVLFLQDLLLNIGLNSYQLFICSLMIRSGSSGL